MDLTSTGLPLLLTVIAVTAYLALQELRRLVAAITPTPARPFQVPSSTGLSTREHPRDNITKRHVKEPPAFHGEANLFREWVFSMDLAIKAIGFATQEEEVTYASSFLVGNFVITANQSPCPCLNPYKKIDLL